MLLNRNALKAHGLGLQGVHVQQMMMEPYQISPKFFNQRMKEVSLEKSMAVFDDLKYAGILKDDNCSHFIQYDDWCASLAPCLTRSSRVHLASPSTAMNDCLLHHSP